MEKSRILVHLFLKIRRFSTRASKMDNALMGYVMNSIPPLDLMRHKGEAGRIGVVGGSLDYTGAPFFAGMSALRVGADLVHIFCALSAAAVIKSYSPELIVHPLLDADDAVDKISPWLDRLHVVVIGPGLGRDPDIINTTIGIIAQCERRSIPLVIDADGLFLLTENRDILIEYPKPGVILTPNLVEYTRLYPRNTLPRHYGDNVSILRKGAVDEFENSITTWGNKVGGTGRRCGGQGDLLSGAIAVFYHWMIASKDMTLFKTPEIERDGLAASVACYAASKLIRLCNEKAFAGRGRSMLATDMIEYIHYAFDELFPNTQK